MIRLPPRARRRLHQLGFALARFGYRYPDDQHPIVSALANATESATTVASWRAAADPRARRFGGAPVPVLFAVELGGCLRRRYPGAAGELQEGDRWFGWTHPANQAEAWTLDFDRPVPPMPDAWPDPDQHWIGFEE